MKFSVKIVYGIYRFIFEMEYMFSKVNKNKIRIPEINGSFNSIHVRNKIRIS